MVVNEHLRIPAGMQFLRDPSLLFLWGVERRVGVVEMAAVSVFFSPLPALVRPCALLVKKAGRRWTHVEASRWLLPPTLWYFHRKEVWCGTFVRLSFLSEKNARHKIKTWRLVGGGDIARLFCFSDCKLVQF